MRTVYVDQNINGDVLMCYLEQIRMSFNLAPKQVNRVLQVNINFTWKHLWVNKKVVSFILSNQHICHDMQIFEVVWDANKAKHTHTQSYNAFRKMVPVHLINTNLKLEIYTLQFRSTHLCVPNSPKQNCTLTSSSPLLYIEHASVLGCNFALTVLVVSVYSQ